MIDTHSLSRLTAAIPAEIQSKPLFLCWKRGKTKPGGRFDKVPYYANGIKRNGTQGGPEDIASLVTFDAALRAVEELGIGLDGIGIAFLPGCGVVAGDFDGCINGDRKVPDHIRSLIDGTYAEISVSGTGLRALWTGDCGSWKDHKKHIEVFGDSGFVTLTGDLVSANGLAPAPDWVKTRPRHVRPDSAGNGDRCVSPETIRDLRSALNSLRSDDYDLWSRMGLALYCLGDVGRGLWLDWSSTSEKYEAGEAARKWDLDFTNATSGYESVFAEAQRHGWVNPLAGVVAGADPSVEGASFKSSIPSDLYVWAADLDLLSFNKTFVVEGLLEADRAYEFFGRWKSGKTLVVADMCCHVCLEMPWAGRRTLRSLVVWVAGESVDDVQRRTAAWRLHHGIAAPMDFIIRTKPVHLDSAKFAIELRQEIEQINTSALPVLAVIDSLARNLSPGTNENSAEGMGAFANHLLDLVVRPLKCTAIVIHHSGHGDQDRSRGWSGMAAAIDGSVKITKARDPLGPEIVTVSTVNMRSTAGGDEVSFRIDVQELDGCDNFGNQIAEPVLQWMGDEFVPPTRQKPRTAMGKNAGKALDVLSKLYTQQRANLEGSDFEPDGASVLISDWRDTCSFPHRSGFSRARDELIAAGKIRMDEPYVRLT